VQSVVSHHCDAVVLYSYSPEGDVVSVSVRRVRTLTWCTARPTVLSACRRAWQDQTKTGSGLWDQTRRSDVGSNPTNGSPVPYSVAMSMGNQSTQFWRR